MNTLLHTHSTRDSILVRVLLTLGGIKIAAGVLGVAFQPGTLAALTRNGLPAWPNLLQCLAYTAAAWVLWHGVHRDERAKKLALVFVLVAAAFANLFIVRGWASLPPPLPELGEILARLALEAFLAFALWRFAAEFPRYTAFGRAAAIQRAAPRVALALGALLFLGNLIALSPELLASHAWIDAAATHTLRKAQGAYWASIFVLVLGALGFVLWKSAHASLPERRRARLFTLGLALGAAPIALDVTLVSLLPPYARLQEDPRNMAILAIVVLPALLSVPFTTTYAVLVRGALDVRRAVRQAIEYAFARYLVIGLLLIPWALLVLLLLDRALGFLGPSFAARGALTLVASAALAVGLHRARGSILHAVDRRFFREPYDTRRALSDLIAHTRGARTLGVVADATCATIDAALHPRNSAALFADPERRAFVDASRRFGALPRDTALARLLRDGPLRIDLTHPRGEVADLPAPERRWLADGGFEVLVPMPRGLDATLAGILALGEKRSQLPYTAKDLAFLGDIAASSAVAAENLVLRDSASGGAARRVVPPNAASEVQDHALECRTCGRVHGTNATQCTRCSGDLQAAVVPSTLRGKFVLESRIGRGGMGVVYKARDTSLGRAVALKTLPRVSPEAATRLRREARAMAAIRHPNLLTIYSDEAWHGTPILVLEFLSGGTLRQRLDDRGRMVVSEALAMTRTLCDVLQRVHRAGVLHRDIKPSNIGFDDEGNVKLMDFGLVKMAAAASSTRDGESASIAPLTADIDSQEPTRSAAASTSAGYLVGTPLYMSPEALQQQPPTPGFDLWALAVVLFEALAGRHPFHGGEKTFTSERVLRGGPPNILELRPDCPEGVAALLHAALSPRLRERPQTARRFSQEIEQRMVG